MFLLPVYISTNLERYEYYRQLENSEKLSNQKESSYLINYLSEVKR